MSEEAEEAPVLSLRAAVRRGWAVFQERPGSVFAGVALAWCDRCGGALDAGRGASLSPETLLAQAGGADPWQILWPLLTATLLASAVSFVVTSALVVVVAFGITGWLRFLAASRDDPQADAMRLVSGVDRLVHQLVFKVVRAVAVGGAVLLAAVPSIALAFGAVLAVGAGTDRVVAWALGGLAVILLPLMLLAWVGVRGLILLVDVEIALGGVDVVRALRSAPALALSAGLAPFLFEVKMVVLFVVAVLVALPTCGVGLLITLPLAAVSYDAGRVDAWVRLTAARSAS